jgi:hypothetical protein
LGAVVSCLESRKIGEPVIWSGNPLEVTEAAEMVLISGDPLGILSRQSKLRDIHLRLQSDKPMQYVDS